jgi:hypothetical protein
MLSDIFATHNIAVRDLSLSPTPTPHYSVTYYLNELKQKELISLMVICMCYGITPNLYLFTFCPQILFSH